jgi:hypothetical protein
LSPGNYHIVADLEFNKLINHFETVLGAPFDKDVYETFAAAVLGWAFMRAKEAPPERDHEGGRPATELRRVNSRAAWAAI